MNAYVRFKGVRTISRGSNPDLSQKLEGLLKLMPDYKVNFTRGWIASGSMAGAVVNELSVKSVDRLS